MDNCDCIIVNYNAGLFLLDSVKSAFSSGVNMVIVVDNNSEDESLDILREELKGKALVIIKNKINLGFSAACNIGINASHAEYKLFLNPDCILDKYALERMLDYLKKSDSIGMVGGFLCNMDGTEQSGGRRNFPTPKTALIRIFKLNKLFPNYLSDFSLHTQNRPDKPIFVDAISGSCMLVKQKAIANVGLWDEAYFLHCEDLDWCMRFQLKEWKIAFVPDAIVRHVKGGCSRRRPFFVEWHKHKGMLRFYKKFFYDKYPKLLSFVVIMGIYGNLLITFLIKGITFHMKKLGIEFAADV